MSELVAEDAVVSESQEGSKHKKNKGLVIFLSIFSVVIVSFLIFCFAYVPKTPEFALYKTFRSVKTHNYEQASYYVNIDKIAENRFNAIKEEALNSPELKDNPFAGLAYMFIDAMEEQVVSLVKSGFKKVVEEPDSEIEKVSDISFAGFLIVKSYNGVKLSKQTPNPATTLITLEVPEKDPVQLTMNKVDKTWQIVDITGYSLIEDED